MVTAKGPNWDHARGIREQRYREEHGAFMDGLVDQGTVILGGPVGGHPDPDVIALLAVNAADDNGLVSVFDADPWISHRILRPKEIWPWTIWLDGRGRGRGQARTLGRLRSQAAEDHSRMIDGFDDRYLRLGTTFGDAGVIRGDLPPECTAAVQAVLEPLGKKQGPEDFRTEPQRFHDALRHACAPQPRVGHLRGVSADVGGCGARLRMVAGGSFSILWKSGLPADEHGQARRLYRGRA